MNYRAFIFDMDGTIVDNMAYHTASWVELFKRRGVRVDEYGFFRHTAGRLSRDIMREYLGADLSDGKCAALEVEKNAIYHRLYLPHRKTIDGFDQFVRAARAAGIKLAIATAAPLENLSFIVDGLDLRQHFDAMVGAQDVKRGKPHPDVFLKAAERCGIAPAECLAFEDAPLGIEGIRRAGMAAVALTTTSERAEFADSSHVIDVIADYRAIGLQQLLNAALPDACCNTLSPT